MAERGHVGAWSGVVGGMAAWVALTVSGACGPVSTKTEPLPGGPPPSSQPAVLPPPVEEEKPVVTPAPNPDASHPADAGVDAGVFVFGTPGPWPVTNVQYGEAQGILEDEVLGVTTDESQNLWVATSAALYLLQPGQARFRRYDAADGLHLKDNPVAYCDKNFGDFNSDGTEVCGGSPEARCPVYGAASDEGITELVGGGPNEVFVGYDGEDGDGDWCDPNRHSGKLDRVRLRSDGTLQVDRFDLVSNDQGGRYWHNRTVKRMVYDHFIHEGELYVGSNHGITRLIPDRYRAPRPGEWFDDAAKEYMADHLHPRVCFMAPCQGREGHSESNQRMGDFRGLAIAPDGDLWVAGKWTAGKIRWVEDLYTWYKRPGSQAFAVAFGDPYPIPDQGNGFTNEPVFKVPFEGIPVYLSAVAVTKDGRVWFSSGPNSSDPENEYGLGMWTGRYFVTFDPITDLGLTERNIRDLAALPDGRLVLAMKSTGLLLWNPNTNEKTPLRGTTWLPDDAVLRVTVDTMVSPPALHVATEGGAAVLRQLP